MTNPPNGPGDEPTTPPPGRHQGPPPADDADRTRPPHSPPPTTPPSTPPPPPPGAAAAGPPPTGEPVDGPTRIGHLPPNVADAAEQADRTVGTTVGPYRVDRLIAIGGMGRVYAGTDTRLNRQVSIKLVIASMAQTSDFLSRFEREATVMAKLDSPHVIAVYDHGQRDGVPYLVTQYAAGGDLGAVLERQGRLDGATAADVCAQVADGLAAAHEVGVIHRDVKPPNVLLRDDRLDAPHAYLGDFGVAHTDSSGLTQPGSIAGTWNYLAPERTTGDRGTPASDVYSLGCLFYECLTGRPPFAGSDVEVALAHVQEPVPQLPTGIDLPPEYVSQANAILSRTLAKDPAERANSAIEVRDQLRLLSGRHHAFATGATVGRSRHGGGRRGRTVALSALAGVAALALIGGAVWWFVGGDETEPGEDEPTTAITGDLDGDGHGDLVAGSSFDSSSDDPAVFLSSTGSALEEMEASTQVPSPQLIGDVDGDGNDDLISLSGEEASLNITTDAEDSSGGLLSLPRQNRMLATMTADFDGDGRDDVGALSISEKNREVFDDGPYTEADDETVQIDVAYSQEDGTWSERQTLWSEVFVGEVNYLDVEVGDLDGSGTDDVLLMDRHYDTDKKVYGVLLTDKTGGDVPRLEPEDPKTNINDAIYRLVDTDGDGQDELIYASRTNELQVYQYADEAWEEQTWELKGSTDEDVSPLHAAVVDIDGNGTEDLVWRNQDQDSNYIPSVTVMLSEDGVWRTESWKAPGLGETDELRQLLRDSSDDQY